VVRVNAEDEIKSSLLRWGGFLVGGGMLALSCLRLWFWSSMHTCRFRNVWEAIVGPRNVLMGNVSCRWSYGLWELFPDGQLAAAVYLIIALSLVLGAVLDSRPFTCLAVAAFVSGYLVNAVMFLRLLANY